MQLAVACAMVLAQRIQVAQTMQYAHDAVGTKGFRSDQGQVL